MSDKATGDLEAAVPAPPHFGTSPEDRKNQLEQARLLSKICNGLGWGVACWGLLYPRPYPVVMALLAILPLAGIVLAAKSQGLYQIYLKKTDRRPSLNGIIFGPALALSSRAVADFHVLDWALALEIAGVGSLVLTAVVLSIDSGMRKISSALPMLFFSAGYAYGAAIQANVLLDHGRPLRFNAPVEEKHVSHGRSTSWVLRLGPWGPRAEPKEVNVQQSLWDKAEVGGQMCIYLSHGTLHVRWFRVEYCGGPYSPVERPTALQLWPVAAGTPHGWALAAGAMYARRNNERINELAGSDISPQTIGRTQQMLGSWWGVTNRNQLLDTLNHLEEGSSQRKAFEEMGRELSSISDDEFQQKLKAAESDNELYQRMLIARKYYTVLGSKSLLGWDYARYIALCRWGFLVGYLSYDEAWEHVMHAASILQRTFSSWADFGQDFLIGRQFWSYEQNTIDGARFTDAYRWLLSDPNSPWQRNPWNMNLSVN